MADAIDGLKILMANGKVITLPVINNGDGTFSLSPGALGSGAGAASTARLASAAASTNATLVKATPGRVYGVQGKNAAAYDVYLVLYDSAANPPVPGTTTIRKKIPLAAGAVFNLSWPNGLPFATGIGFALTKLAADADTTVLVAADVLQLNIDYA
jgi:hypothetical protein